ncbi:transporter [Martelella alba]|uniref:Transporter n=1 Tax=Martelella alba TaxID=2590451 RepID=A0ABY2SGF1_9HYPH|nr:transporter [Martelella alba]TKI04229.1 transporter [Martelella alba]
MALTDYITKALGYTAAYGCLIWLSPSAALAGSARDYLNAPIDSWLTFYNVGYSTSVTPEDGTDITSSVRANVLTQSVMVTRTMDYWGRTGGLSVVLPHRYLEATSDDFRASGRGISDVGFLWQMNMFGAPALTREQFHTFTPGPFSSFHLFIGTPLGTYDATDAMNPSSNRWTISPTVNYSYTPDQGWTWYETYLTARFFTDNNDYRVGGASRLSQKPLYTLEGHASRNVTQRLWLSADAYYNFGGETRIDNTDQDNRASTLRLGVGLGLNAWAGGDLIFNYEGVVAKPSGQPDGQTVRLTVRQFW